MEELTRKSEKQREEQESAVKETKGHRETTSETTGVEYDIGLSPQVLKALSEINAVY